MRNNKWLADRLRELDNKTQSGLAKLLGVSRAAVTGIVNGTRQVKGHEIQIIARYLEWPTDRVAGLLSDPDMLPLNLVPAEQSMTRVYVVGAVEAGEWREALEYLPDESLPFIDVSPDPRYGGARRFALQVRGPSMNLVYPEGSHLIVIPTMDLGEGWQPRDGQRVVVQRINDEGAFEATVKEYRIDSDGQAWLSPRSSSPAFSESWRVPDSWQGNGDFDEHTDNLRITGLVIQSVHPEP